MARDNTSGGYANIVPSKGDVVWGVLYEVTDKAIEKLDRREGYPEHYGRKELSVELDDGNMVKALVYIAKPKYVRDGLKPTKKYLEHLLSARDLLPEDYVKMLEGVETLD